MISKALIVVLTLCFDQVKLQQSFYVKKWRKCLSCYIIENISEKGQE